MRHGTPHGTEPMHQYADTATQPIDIAALIAAQDKE